MGIRRAVIAVASLALVACGVTAVPRGLDTPASASSSARWIGVTVATLWTQPGIARSMDEPSTRCTKPDIRGWLASMTTDDRRWLVGHLETQALYGRKVYVLATSGTWSKVAVTGQPTPRNSLGYPGWLPTCQLRSNAPASTTSYAVVRTPTAWLWSGWSSSGVAGHKTWELSYDTRLPVVTATSSYVVVSLLDGSHRAMRRSTVVVHRASAAWAPTGSQLLAQARKFLGLQYLWAGTSGFGFDCSGFTHSIYHAIGKTISRDADAQAQHGTFVYQSQLVPGDLVFFRTSSGSAITHVAMYYGVYNGARSIIEAPRTGYPVRIVPLSTYSSSQYAGARRYLSG